MTDKLKVALIGCGQIGYGWDPSIAGSGSEAFPILPPSANQKVLNWWVWLIRIPKFWRN